MPEFGTNIQELPVNGSPTIIIARCQIVQLVGTFQFAPSAQTGFGITISNQFVIFAGTGSSTNFSFRMDGVTADVQMRAGTALGTTSLIPQGITNTGAEILNRVGVSDVNYVQLFTDCIIGFTAISAARTVTLLTPTASRNGMTVIVKDESGNASGVNTITISPAAGTIDGAASKVINTAFGSLRFYCNGSNWFTY